MKRIEGIFSWISCNVGRSGTPQSVRSTLERHLKQSCLDPLSRFETIVVLEYMKHQTTQRRSQHYIDVKARKKAIDLAEQDDCILSEGCRV